MSNLKSALIDECVQHLQQGFESVYKSEPERLHLLTVTAQTTLSALAQSTAAYHDVEHTILVTLTGQEILLGKRQRGGRVSPEDWLHTLISLLCHDIGYLRGICRSDRPHQNLYSTGSDRLIQLSPTATDASLTPYHVDRGQQFIDQVFGQHPLLKPEILKRNLEITRFPVPKGPLYAQTNTMPGLVRAADLIGQLSDPNYLEKLPALFKEFQEVGCTAYRSAEELRTGFPRFYHSVVLPYIRPAMAHLKQTAYGRAILFGLHANLAVVQEELAESRIEAERSDRFHPVLTR